MPTANDSRGIIGKRREVSQRDADPVARTSKRQKIWKAEVPGPSSPRDPDIQLCSYCEHRLRGTGNPNGERDDSNCPCCELMANALPMNTQQEARIEMRMLPLRLRKGGTIYSCESRRRYGQIVGIARSLIRLHIF
jgi:hypothetical protein